MSLFEIDNRTNGFTISNNGEVVQYPKGALSASTKDGGSNLAHIGTVGGNYLYNIDLSSDTVNIDGVPFSGTSEDLVIALDAVFSHASGNNNDAWGFMDYNDTTGDVVLSADTWTDVPNNGLGAFTNKAYKPTLVNEVIDTTTGYLDFSELTLGSQLIIRNDFTVTPSTNNALLEARYLLGQGQGEYPLLFWSERLDNGSGMPYQRVPIFSIYMGDTNTQVGVGKLQVRLSTNGTLNNAGSYINIQVRK